MFDLLIRGGTLIDGTGAEGFIGDVAISDGNIVAMGQVDGPARSTIDASGRYVTPGFIDGHTHLDAQIFWDPYAGSLTAHGVTSAVMGNCGFTLGPGRSDQADLIVRSIERAEDMSRDAIGLGVPWTWADFPEFMNAIDAIPKALNICTQIGHSALRASVMGERAFTDAATPDEVAQMARVVKGAIKAGAIGFSTSRNFHHLTKAGMPVASRIASWEEVTFLVMSMSEMGTGIFQLAPERPSDSREMADFQDRIRSLAVASGRPVTFMIGGQEEQFETIESVVAVGGAAFGQVHVRGFENIFGFRTSLPFDRLPLWNSVRSASFEKQRSVLQDVNLRRRLVEEAESGNYGDVVGAEVRAPKFDQITIIDEAEPREKSVAEVADLWSMSPADAMIQLSLDSDFGQLFRQPLSNVPSDLILRGLRHPNAVIAASDSGAHVSQILDSNIPTYFLSHWVRSEGAFSWPEAIRMLTGIPAKLWGLDRRGILRVGNHADVLVFDPNTIDCATPTVKNDLPDGGPRLDQAAIGIDATVVNGVLVQSTSGLTGATPGQLLRGSPKSVSR